MTSARRPVGFTGLPLQAQWAQGSRAGAVSRGAANVIDGLVLFVAMIALYLGVAAVKFLWRPRTFTFPAPSWNVITIVVGSLTVLYFAISWMTSGRTYGDRVLGLRVVNRRGERVHAVTSVGTASRTRCTMSARGITSNLGCDSQSSSVRCAGSSMPLSERGSVRALSR